mmetsp:Transcript_4737/g.13363  ORF Transcript_4737/g.13363 Transcript_4737/m.13363 type:complete len:217 (+) Transcript_4737:699-1349(+)
MQRLPQHLLLHERGDRVRPSKERGHHSGGAKLHRQGHSRRRRRPRRDAAPVDLVRRPSPLRLHERHRPVVLQTTRGLPIDSSRTLQFRAHGVPGESQPAVSHRPLRLPEGHAGADLADRRRLRIVVVVVVVVHVLDRPEPGGPRRLPRQVGKGVERDFGGEWKVDVGRRDDIPLGGGDVREAPRPVVVLVGVVPFFRLGAALLRFDRGGGGPPFAP